MIGVTSTGSIFQNKIWMDIECGGGGLVHESAKFVFRFADSPRNNHHSTYKSEHSGTQIPTLSQHSQDSSVFNCRNSLNHENKYLFYVFCHILSLTPYFLHFLHLGVETFGSSFCLSVVFIPPYMHSHSKICPKFEAINQTYTRVRLKSPGNVIPYVVSLPTFRAKLLPTSSV
jgi:hypothetical protein